MLLGGGGEKVQALSCTKQAFSHVSCFDGYCYLYAVARGHFCHANNYLAIACLPCTLPLGPQVPQAITGQRSCVLLCCPQGSQSESPGSSAAVLEESSSRSQTLARK